MLPIRLSVVVAVVAGAQIASAQSDSCACASLFPSANGLASIAYGNGQFVAVGSTGAIMTSTDGMDWVPRCSPSKDDFSSLAFGNGQFVAVSPACFGQNGCPGTIITSADGVNWVVRPRGSSISSGFNGIAFGNGLFAIVCGGGGSGIIITSTDAINWTAHQTGLQNNLTYIAFGDGQFVVASDGGQIVTSTNGVNWVRRESGTTADFGALAYGGGEFVGTTFANTGRAITTIVSSPDGIHWNQSWAGTDEEDWGLSGVAYGNGVWVAVGEKENQRLESPLLLTSNDGINWVQHDTSQQDNRLSSVRSIAYQNGQFVAVGDQGTILTSADATNWVLRQSGTQIQVSGSTNTQLASVGSGPLDTWTNRYRLPPAFSLGFLVYGNGQFVAVGDGVSETSNDGTNWALQQSGPTSNGLNGIAYGNGQFVAVAAGGTVNTSTDGVNWVSHQTQAANLYGIGYGGGLFVAVGGGGTLLTSMDAVNWAQVKLGTANELDAVAYGNGQFVVVGPYISLTSADGVNWAQYQTQAYTYLVAYGNGQFVAVDLYNGAVSSTDGVNWVRSSAKLHGIGFGNGQFVGTSDNSTIFTSTDGLNWSAHFVGTSDIGRGIAYGDGEYVTVGFDGTILSSTNGADWTLRQSPMPRWLGGIGYGNGQYIAVGQYGAILTSADGANWSQQQSGTQYTLTGIAYGDGQFVAVGSDCPGCSRGSSAIVTSTDGAHWVPSSSGMPYVLASVAYGNGQFVAVGGWVSQQYPYLNGAILTSTNGLVWVARQSGAEQYFTSVTSGDRQYAAVGNSALMAASDDGVNWATCEPNTTINLNGVAYGNGKFVAVGGRYFYDSWGDPVSSESTILTSSDGVSWMRQQAGTSNVLAAVTYEDGEFVAVGGDAIISSADGVNWVRRQSGTGNWFSALTGGNGRFVALGNGGTAIFESGQAGLPSGPLGLWIDAGFTNVAIGYSVPFTVWHTGLVSQTVWDFGDGTLLTNQPMSTHFWSVPGTYTVRLTAYSDTYPLGVSVTAQVTVSATVYYVNEANLHPLSPYTNWATAATTIQAAIDAATIEGRLVLVSNGVYRAGITSGTNGQNRVILSHSVELRSVNGPEVTAIEGDTGGVRCAYVGDGSVLSGFILTKGTAVGDWPGGSGGGVWCEPFGVVNNCVIMGNSAENDGGGVAGGTLHNCRLIDNTSLNGNGGGANGVTLYNCVLTGNLTASGWGGGGGGAYGGSLYNCTLVGNSAGNGGGGASSASLYNCIVFFNQGPDYPNHNGCSFEHSCASPLPPGPGNIDVDPQLITATHLSLTSPCVGAGDPAYATGTDIDSQPWARPPAIGAEEPESTSGPLSLWISAPNTNIGVGYAVPFTAFNSGPILKSIWDFGDGTVLTNQPLAMHAWTSPGTYEIRLTGYNQSYPQGVSATVVVNVDTSVYYVDANSKNPIFPFSSWETAATTIQDAIGAGTLAGRLVLVTNGNYRIGAVETNGLNRAALTNQVVVRSVNGPSATVIEGETNGIRCVYVDNGSVLSGFTLTKGTAVGNNPNGSGALCGVLGVLTNCVVTGNSAENDGGGVYGGILYNCELSANSVQDAGGGADTSTLFNCVLSDNSAKGGGGGADYCSLYNCLLGSNSATVTVGAYGSGGAAQQSTLYNCVLTGNVAVQGGGVYLGTLYNCTLAANSALTNGGAAVSATLYNCIVYFNTAVQSPNYDGSTLNYCCTTPQPLTGLGNITNAPLFVDYANGNFHLQSNSPCINSGNNVFVTSMTDLDGNPRIVGGTVDIGAYEFQAGLQLALIPSRANVILTWPTNFTGYTLQSTISLGPAAIWTTNSTAPVVINGQYTMTNPISGTQQFFRLSQ
jgi:hypothetical protein